MSDPIAFEEVSDDLQALLSSTEALPITATPGHWWRVATALQLALRHPALREGLVGQELEAIARQIFERLATTEPLQRLAEQGWDPRRDE